jgi:hypothetical protein
MLGIPTLNIYSFLLLCAGTIGGGGNTVMG